MPQERMDCFVAALLAMTEERALPVTGSAKQEARGWIASSLRSSQSRWNLSAIAPQRVAQTRALVDRLREANPLPFRHCERSEAIHLAAQRKNGLLRRCAPRNDEEGTAAPHNAVIPAHAGIQYAAASPRNSRNSEQCHRNSI